jgi:hypothetical protein
MWLRVAACAVAATVLPLLDGGDAALWGSLVIVAWLLAYAAELEDQGAPSLVALGRRILATALTFHYVCLAWIFFRAQTFDGALAVLRQLADYSPGHANVTPLVQAALLIGFAAHFWPDGAFRWLRDRFCAQPPWLQGLVLAVAALILRELSHPKLVKFIYFEF